MKKPLKLDEVSAPMFLVVLTSASLLMMSSVEPAYPQSSDDKKAKTELKTPLSLTKVKEIERKISKLKPGTKDVIKILGLTNYSNSFGVTGSGPTDDYRSSYYLRKGYSLMLVHDLTKKPPMFKRAVMFK